MSKVKAPKKAKQAKPVKPICREKKKHVTRRERKLQKKRREKIQKNIDRALGIFAVLLCVVSSVLDVINNKKTGE